MKVPTLPELRSRVVSAARAISRVAFQGIPAMRAALHGARMGAGRAFSPAVVERLGFQILPSSAAAMGQAVGRVAGDASMVLRRGNYVLRAGAKQLLLHSKDGMMLRVTPDGGATAAVTHDAIATLARSTTRGALRGIGRASLGGAVAGAVLEGVVTGLWVLRSVRRGEMSGAYGARKVGKNLVRGALAGGVGVAAAGAVSFAMAATGVTLAGPVVIPLAAMVAMSSVASSTFDRVFGR